MTDIHTFFINTSKKTLDGYEVLFDIHYENKNLVSMDCPMSEWYDREKGYLNCIKKMSDMIDGYTELNNSFNLIIYIDLLENEAYSSIKRDAFHDKEREECCRAMHILFTHVINESIVDELIDSGRRPKDILIMFGEEKKFADFKVSTTDPSRPEIMKKLFEYIGLPEQSVVEEIAKAVDKEDVQNKVELFDQKIQEICKGEIVPGIRGGYAVDLALWSESIMTEANVEKANLALFERIHDINRVEADRGGIEKISCPYDCYASKVNKSILSLSRMNIAVHLLMCIEDGTIYNLESDKEQELKEFRIFSIDEIGKLLKEKEDIFAGKVSEIETSLASYADLKLAPALRAFNYTKFGLDEYGDKAVELIVQDVKENEKKKADEKKKTDEAILVEGNDKEVVVADKEVRNLFSEEEFPLFDYQFEDKSSEMLKKKTTPEEYIEQAKGVRMHHLDYLKKLKIHISDVLSNYAGKSKENKPALLQIGGYRYAGPGKEDKVIETVTKVSDKAYDTITKQYMEFCASRDVVITDIEDQCNWFVSRINQIRESLRKIKIVALGLLIAIIILYIPFAVIQFDAIVANIITASVAAASFVVPVLLLYVVFLFMVAAQKRKYLKAWLEFKAKSDEILEKNTEAVRKYDQLLSIMIPAMRWIYEYKLDVDFCAECCDIADAKIEHHRHKLRDRVTAIKNILGDLEYLPPEEEEVKKKASQKTETIDYNVSFCSGKKNQDFYAVINKKLINQKDS